MENVPGAGYGGYARLKEIVEQGRLASKKILFEYKDNKIYANGKALQGLIIAEDYAQIKGIHYTSWENATQIRSMGRIEPALDDPFVYISEPGKMQRWPEKRIRKETGAASADTEVRLQAVVPVERVWIKASRDAAHYAITGIISDEIQELSIQRRKAR